MGVFCLMLYNVAMIKKATQQAKGVSPISGVAPPKHTQFGAVNANPRNNGGVPKHVREIRTALKDLLDPNLSIKDYQKIIKEAEDDSGLLGVFATAIIKKDHRTIIQLIDQAWGKPKETVDYTMLEPPKPLEDLTKGK